MPSLCPPSRERNPSTKTDKVKPSERANNNDLLDRHNRAIAQILTRFRNMIMAAAAPLPQSATIEHASLNSLTMKQESEALVHEVEGLLALNREIKALWIRGPLRQPGDDDGREAEIDRKAEAVTALYQQLVGFRNAQLEGEAREKSRPVGGGGEGSA